MSDPPAPSKTITVYGADHPERSANVSISYTPESNSCEIIYLTEQFTYLANRATIYVWDMYFGTLKSLQPKEPDTTNIFELFIPLSDNFGLLQYRIIYPQSSAHITLVSLDLDDGSYSFVGERVRIRPLRILTHNVLAGGRLILLNANLLDGAELWFIEVDLTSTTFKFTKTITIPRTGYFFNLINNKLIFTSVVRYGRTDCVLANFNIINDDNSFTEIRNSGATIDVDPQSASNFKYQLFVHWDKIQGCWHGSRLFTCFNLVRFVHAAGKFSTVPGFSMYELETNVWSEIRVNLHCDKFLYRFRVDNDGMLHIVTYDGAGSRNQDPTEMSFGSIRIPLKKPDKLIRLCWFQVHDCGVSGTLVRHINPV